MKKYYLFVAIFVLLEFTLLAYAYMVLGDDLIGKPAFRAPTMIFTGIELVIRAAVYAFLPSLAGALGVTAALSALRGFYRYAVFILCYSAVWLAGAYFIADSFIPDLGQTYSEKEVLVGFVLINGMALALMAAGLLIGLWCARSVLTPIGKGDTLSNRIITLLAIGILVSISCVIYMNTRVEIRSTFYAGDNKFDMADVTDWVQSGGTVVSRYGAQVAVRLPTAPPITNEESWKLIGKAMVRTGKIVLAPADQVGLDTFDPRNNTQYDESWAMNKYSLMHQYVTSYKAPSGVVLKIYPEIAATETRQEAVGDLVFVKDCVEGHECPNHITETNLYFLSSPEEY